MYKGFICYAEEDFSFVQLLKNVIEKQGIFPLHSVILWNESEITLGTEWELSIQKKVESCDFALLMLSRNFFSSHKIQAIELPSLLERKVRKERFAVIPILVRPMPNIQEHVLSHYKYFTFEGKENNVVRKNLSFSELIYKHDWPKSALNHPEIDKNYNRLLESIHEVLLKISKSKRVIPAELDIDVENIIDEDISELNSLLNLKRMELKAGNPYEKAIDWINDNNVRISQWIAKEVLKGFPDWVEKESDLFVDMKWIGEGLQAALLTHENKVIDYLLGEEKKFLSPNISKKHLINYLVSVIQGNNHNRKKKKKKRIQEID